jgi:hypothetical protein
LGFTVLVLTVIEGGSAGASGGGSAGVVVVFVGGFSLGGVGNSVVTTGISGIGATPGDEGGGPEGGVGPVGGLVPPGGVGPDV